MHISLMLNYTSLYVKEGTVINIKVKYIKMFQQQQQKTASIPNHMREFE